ncbi:hypothetical protein PG999_000163 [Apiospora kogelbergensis]|uniref:Wax synthase domain-containing protein n=1 Tax=Apiospora kogelbergensis TaxID=1337665 RepID=A0AAW0RAP6_9PEZI
MLPGGDMLYAELLLFQVILTVTPILPHGQHNSFWLASFVILASLYLRILQSSAGSPSADWGLALAITPQLGKAFDFFVLHPTETRQLREHKSHQDQARSNGVASWAKKFLLSMEMIHTPRGVGWNWEIPYVCYVGTESKRSFLLSRTWRIVWYYVLLDALAPLVPTRASGPLAPLPQMSDGSQDPAYSYDQLRRSAATWALTTLLPAWAYAVSAYVHLWLVHTGPAALAVLLGLCAPADCPYVMGPVGAMASLRGLWGRTWHQAARRQMTAIADAIGRRLLGLRPGGRPSAYLKLALGFFLGGATHAVAGYMATKASKASLAVAAADDASGPVRNRWDILPLADPTGAMRFFGLQLVGVVLEDAVFALLLRFGVLREDWRRNHMANGRAGYGKDMQWWWSRRRGESSVRIEKVLGYAWVVFWLSLTLPPYVEGIRQTGVMDSKLAPISIWRSRSE